MKNVGHKESPSRKCRIRSHILVWIDGEGVRIWSTNKSKIAPSGGEYRASVGEIIRSGTTC